MLSLSNSVPRSHCSEATLEVLFLTASNLPTIWFKHVCHVQESPYAKYANTGVNTRVHQPVAPLALFVSELSIGGTFLLASCFQPLDISAKCWRATAHPKTSLKGEPLKPETPALGCSILLASLLRLKGECSSPEEKARFYIYLCESFTL